MKLEFDQNICHVTGIHWSGRGRETDDLPTEVDIPASMLNGKYDNPYIAVEDYLLSVYGCAVGGFCVD